MRVLITGCSTGIGRASVQALARRGHAVVATARDAGSLADLDAEARLALDVDDDASVAAAVAAAGPIDALVNNAGRNASGPVEATPLAAGREVLETNLFGAVRMIQAVLPGLRARGRGGAIVNVSSVSGRVGAPLGGFYTASKFALEGLSECLALEVGHFDIRVSLVEPGFFATEMRHKNVQHGDAPPYDELYRQWNGADGKLLGGERPGPEAVAEAIADAVEGKDERLRIPVGADAEMVLGTRARLDDAAFEAAMRQALKMDW